MTYKVDLHAHTMHSGDNDARPEDMVEAAIKRGLWGIAFSEHDSYAASSHAIRLSERYRGRIHIFRAVEYSAREGHCLVFGADTDRLAIKYASTQSLLDAVSDIDGVVVPSHPYRRGSGIGDLLMDLKGLVALEGANGCNLHSMNEQALRTAQALGLHAVGGSDAHGASEVGACYTEFYDEVTADNIAQLIKLGRYRAVDNRKISTRMMF